MDNPLNSNSNVSTAEDEEDTASFEGMEVDDIESQEDIDTQTGPEDDDLLIDDNGEEDDDANETAAKSAEEEKRAYENALAERSALLAKETEEVEESVAGSGEGSKPEQDNDPYKRFGFLIAQSEVFAHFLAGSIAAEEKNRKGKKGKGLGRGKGKGSGRGRMSEAAEDAQLMAQSQSAQKVTRLEKQPGILVKECKMHPYQLEGLNWLIKLHDTGLNGILADEMGLGKTLQTISLLAWLREGRGVKGPHLVIVPKSVVGNWMNELKKWCPVIRGLKLLGNKDGPGTFLGLTFLACSIK